MEINASNTENVKELPEDQKATGISRKQEKAAIAKKASTPETIPIVPKAPLKAKKIAPQKPKAKKNVPKVKKVVDKVAKAVINKAKVVAKAVKKDKRHGKKNRGKNRKG